MVRKRVLLIEESDASRGVAEAVLRQNAYEVISVTSGEKAQEVLNYTRPDLIIIGCDIKGKGYKPFYESIQQDTKTSSIPMLLLSNPEEAGLPFPEEVIIPRPFDPKDFLEKVNTFAGQWSAPQHVHDTQVAANPLSNASLEDDFLDAALGLDQLDVTESEVMDKTQSIKLGSKGDLKEKIGRYDHHEKDTDILSDTNKVESLMIRDGDGEIGHQERHSKPQEKIHGTGKLEILNDQYGLIDPASINPHHEDAVHDYNWFVNEMQIDNKPKSPKPAMNQSSGIHISDNSSFIDPVTPPPKSQNPKNEQTPGVDKFIDEFKKEIEKIQADEPESITIDAVDKSVKSNKKDSSWEDMIEQLTPDSVRLFTQQLTSKLAENLAEKIASKIDPDKLLLLLKAELIKNIENIKK